MQSYSFLFCLPFWKGCRRLSGHMLSKTMQKRISRFSQYDTILDRYLVSMPLIAQLGRNFKYDKTNTGFTGEDLLELACKRIISVQKVSKRQIIGVL